MPSKVLVQETCVFAGDRSRAKNQTVGTRERMTRRICHSDRDTTSQRASCSSNLVSQEARETIAVMLRQEERIYQCPDYLDCNWLAQQWASEKKQEAAPLVEECASLVTKLDIQDHSKEKSPSSTAVTAASRFIEESSKPVTPTLAREQRNSHLGQWRYQMCGWAFSAADTFGLDREIVAVAFQLLDRYLAKETLACKRLDETIAREDFQLYTMTALYIAVKMLEPTRKLSVECLRDMSRDYYSELDILSTELDILHALCWHLNPPTALAFIRLILDATQFQHGPNFFAQCRRLTELAVQDSSLISSKASSVAVAAILYCAEQDCSYSERSIDLFLDHAKELGVSMSQVMTVYHRLEIPT